MRGGAAPGGAAPGARGGAKNCVRCANPQAVVHFPLADDPVAVDRDDATRHWCGTCLVDAGHITQARYDRHLADSTPLPPVRLSQAQAAQVEAKVREHQLVNGMLDRAANDPVYAAAIQRAAAAVPMVQKAAVRTG